MQRLEMLYQMSIELIDSTPNLTTHQIPDNLLDIWHCNEEVTPDPSQELATSVAIYKHAAEKYSTTMLESSAENHRYLVFQYLLAAEHLSRRLNVRFRPRQIFNFERYNEPLIIDLKAKQLARFKKEARGYVHLFGRV